MCARATRSFDAQGLARAEGARSTAAWLRVVGRIEAGRAGRQVRHARALATFPATEEALAEGRINSDVVTRITAADNDRIDVALRRDESDLIDVAASSTYKEFSDHLDRWIETNDPDGGHRERPDGRRVHCSRTLGGAWALDGWLHPVSGRTFVDELERIEQIFFEHDWAEARRPHVRRARLAVRGRPPHPRKPRRRHLPVQRRHPLRAPQPHQGRHRPPTPRPPWRTQARLPHRTTHTHDPPTDRGP